MDLILYVRAARYSALASRGWTGYLKCLLLKHDIPILIIVINSPHAFRVMNMSCS